MSFKEVMGHSELIACLARAIKRRRFSSAYLFTGPEGVGKSLVAANAAKAINCQEAKEEGMDSCGICVSCLKIDNHNHPDVTWIGPGDASAKIGIEDIRKIQKEISLKPYEGEVKTFIIPEADAMTAEAANALLKTLEEPPGAALLILTSSNPMLLFPTIISRCQKFKFSALKLAEVEEILVREHNLDSGLAHFLAAISEGKLGKALRLKEEDIPAKRDEMVNNMQDRGCWMPDNDRFDIKDKSGIENMLAILLSWYRDMLVLKSGLDCSLLINADREKDIRLEAGDFSFPGLERAIKCIDQTRNLISRNVNPKLALDVMEWDLKNSEEKCTK